MATSNSVSEKPAREALDEKRDGRNGVDGIEKT